MNCYPFIEAENAGNGNVGNVKRACELLKVSRAAYYADRIQRAGGGSDHQRRDAELTEKIAEIHDTSKRTYGSPRIHRELADQAQRCSRKRVARLMRQAGRYGRTPRRWKKTTTPDPAAQTRADLVSRDFTVDADAINTRWCGDITYIHTWQGWLYLATIIDLASRRVVGWAAADHLRTDLVADALTNAVNHRRPPTTGRGVVFHSDRGCQYTSTQYANLAKDLNVTLSVGRTGQCWDNAVAESFFASLKTELIHTQAWPTRKAATSAIFNYIEGWYNTRRRHSTLGYLSPTQFESNTSHTAEQVA